MEHRTAFTPRSFEGDQRFARLWKLLIALIAAGVVVISAGSPVWAHSQTRGEVGIDDGEQFRHAADQALGDEPARAQMASTASCSLEEDTVLTEEIRDCGALRITGDGITVDLNGFTIGGVLIEGNGVTLRNGTVAWSEGTAIYIAGSGAVLEELTVQGPGEVDDSTGFGGFVVEVGNNTTIRKSVFRDLGGVAVDQYYGGGTVVSHSTFVGNYIGVSIQEMGGAIIENNRFEGNMRGVNVWDEEPAGGAVGTIVRRNQLVGNEVGIRVRGEQDASGTLIERNTIRDSATSGVLVTSQHAPIPGWTPGGAADTVIRNNVVAGSGDHPEVIEVCDWEDDPIRCDAISADDGITVLGLHSDVLATIEVEGNQTLHNAGYGIEAEGVTDGGRNVAVRNAAGSCVGVVCRGR